MAETIELAEGHRLRWARPSDRDSIVELELAAFGMSDEPRLRAHLDRPGGTEGWTVVERGNRIVSACGMLDHELWIDGTTVRAAQIEWVATAPGHRRVGLVRAQFAWHHRRARDLGVLVLLVSGIPYVYRRLGYGYGLSWPGTWTVAPGVEPPSPRPPTTVRDATVDDVDALLSTGTHRPSHQVHIARSRSTWDLLVSYARPDGPVQLLVAELDGKLTGWAKLEASPDDHELWVLPAHAEDMDAARALLAEASRRRRPGDALEVMAGPGTWGTQVAALGPRGRYDHGIFVRTPDPHGLLDALRPTLNRRLAEAEHHESGDLDISLYRSTVRLHLEHGELVGVGAGPVIQDPFDNNDVGVAPDWFGALALGRWGATRLAERCDDVTLGRYPTLVEALFPKLPSDVTCDL